MDIIAGFDSNEDIFKILPLTIGAFRPTLEGKSAIHDCIARRKTFQYGASERHQLDVYYPTESTPNPPILFVIYGGGFVSGERTLPAPNSVGYGNVASYFTSKGFLTIIPDYRLAPTVKYPDPAVDVRDAVEWVVNNVDKISPEIGANTEEIFLLGASAGVTHILTALLSPEITPSVFSKVGIPKGLVFVGGAYRVFEELAGPTEAYYGSVEASRGKVPIALLNAEKAKKLPPILMFSAQFEPTYIMKAGDEFLSALHGYGRADVNLHIATGHNHISVFWGLGTNDERAEKWAEDSVSWMKKMIV